MRISKYALYPALLAAFILAPSAGRGAEQGTSISRPLVATVEAERGSYSLRSANGLAYLRGATIAAKVDHRWLRAVDYRPPSIVTDYTFGELGRAKQWIVAYHGVSGQPDLIYRLRVYDSGPFADLQVTVKNSTARVIGVQDIRPLELAVADGMELGGPDADDRVLSDSFSEARPAMRIRDFADAPALVHKGVDVQLIYNRKSSESWFAGALTTDKFLTILRLHLNSTRLGMGSYEIDSAGTTELTKDNSLRDAPPEDLVELTVTVKPGKEIESERLLLSLGSDYHRQLDTYASIIKVLHHARVSAPAPMGWWSWTAYYTALTQDEALTNARWLASNLKSFGYKFFHIDEGYSIARGDYLTPNPERFPDGMKKLESKIAGLGLIPGVWTAPFEVSDRSWVYLHHPEWLVHNTAGMPIPLANHLFVLDTTHPDAQEYLKKTYLTMVLQWGLRYIKLDFMEDSCIEGEHYRPNTTALEAQRIGLNVIRSAVGQDVLLDKDESVMLNPVGIVDIGRLSHDTGHNFATMKSAAWGIAARYYMNRNFFVADPDAFMVTASAAKGQLTLDEAKVSIALAAVSGGMFEIGDQLPNLSSEPDRLALIENRDLIEISRLGKASIPLDLMNYQPDDGQPSFFFLKETPQQSILTIFNWTDGERTHTVSLTSLGLNKNGTYKIVNVWSGNELETCHGCLLRISQDPHSVQMLKIVDPPPLK